MRFAIGAMIVCAGAAQAAPTSFTWEWNGGGGGTSMNGGIMTGVSAAYNSATERFTWSVSYSNQVTDGFTLAVNDGPNPKGIVGELALVYFDASDVNDVRVSAFEYNGQNNSSSHSNPANLIDSSDRAGFIVDASVTDANGGRTFNLEMDVSVINGFTPTPDASNWTGIGFDERIGAWFHSFRNLSTGYTASGQLNSWSGQQGYLDFSNGTGTPVPMPTGVAMAAVGLGLVATRRRRAA